MHHILLTQLALLFFTAIVAGIIDTIAGGGGLITVPAILLTGLPPALALGTSRFQAMVGECNASRRFLRHGGINLKLILPGLLYAFFGAAVGSCTVKYIHPDILSKIIPFLTLAVLIYIIFSNQILKISEKFIISPNTFYCVAGLIIGFYNGFFGPGTGSFWVFALMFFLAFDLKQATLYGKLLNTAGTLAATVYFVYARLVNYEIALTMSGGQLIGTYIGSHLVIKKGTELIRPVFIGVVSILTISLFLHAWGG
jgi:uncharacterized membrane protein YfcA